MKLVFILEHFAGRNIVELLAAGRTVIGLLRPFLYAVQTERVLTAVDPPPVVNWI
mgnify:CR=1 FL=1